MESKVSGHGSSGSISKQFADGGIETVFKSSEINISEYELASLDGHHSISPQRSSDIHPVRAGKSLGKLIAKPGLICSCRLILSVVSGFGLMNLYIVRFSMGVAMTWMVDQKAEESKFMSNNTHLRYSTCKSTATPTKDATVQFPTYEMPKFPNGEFVWSEDIQDTIKSSIFWGYILTQIPGGWLAERYGGKRFIGWAILTCGIGDLLVPLTARLGYQFLIALRVLQGIAQGVVWPSMFVIWARWATPSEKQRLITLSFSGSLLGIVIIFPGIVLLVKLNVDWPMVFYLSGICGIVWTLAWNHFAYDSPLLHPRISEIEKTYIHRSLRKTITKQMKNQPPTPWKALLTSVPVWVLVACNTFNDFTLYFLIDSLFNYLTAVLGYNDSVARMIDTMPYIMFFIVSNLTAAIYDIFTTKKNYSQTRARRIGNTIGTVVPAFLVFVAGFMDCDKGVYSVILVIAGISMCGFQYGAGFLCNFLDIAPQHTGVTFGIANTMSTVAGISEPYVRNAITKDHLLSQWRNLFTLLALVFLLEAAIFALFGTAKIQEWALPPSEDKEDSQTT